MYQLTERSGNSKTGPIPVSTSGRDTCPPSCPLYERGCYAKGGPLGIHWNKVTEGERGVPWEEFLEQVKALPRGQVWRHNQAGDLPGKGELIDVKMLEELVLANRGRRGFTYTHKKPGIGENAAAIAAANKAGFKIILSANNIEQADEYFDLGIAPVAVILHEHAENTTYTPKGRYIIACPAEYTDHLTCARCQICTKNPNFIIGFKAHGNAKNYVSRVAMGRGG